jgi:hypothetical protein
MTSRSRGHIRPVLAAIATLAALAVLAPAALAETAAPSPGARIAHAEFLPYMDPPAGGAATVCLVDTGVDLNPDTQPTVVERVALDGGDAGDVWDHKHGTEMAMTMGAPANGWGTLGAWPLVRIVSVRAMPAGATGFPFSSYAKGIVACLKRPAVQVINLSFSGPRPSDDEIAHLDSYAAQARTRDVSLVAGAGNAGGGVEWPAADPAVFAVAAAGSDRVLCDFSARGPEVALAAPGCGLELADAASGAPISYAGTSPAAAFASAVLAALRSYRPDLTAGQTESLLRQTAANGVLDAQAAFRAAGLGAQVDAAAARVPAAPVTPAPDSTQQQASASPPALDSGSLGWPELDVSTDQDTPRGWPAPRLRPRRCSARMVVVRLRNRPKGVTVSVRLYRRRGEFGSHLLSRRRAHSSSVRVRGGFDYLTVQYTGRGRKPSPTVRVAACGSAR